MAGPRWLLWHYWAVLLALAAIALAAVGVGVVGFGKGAVAAFRRARTYIDDAVNPIGVHTLDSEHASDLVMVEVGGVLFVVDIYNPGLPVTPEAEPILPRVLELGLDIDVIAGGHGATIAWDDFVAIAP